MWGERKEFCFACKAPKRCRTASCLAFEVGHRLVWFPNPLAVDFPKSDGDPVEASLWPDINRWIGDGDHDVEEDFIVMLIVVMISVLVLKSGMCAFSMMRIRLIFGFGKHSKTFRHWRKLPNVPISGLHNLFHPRCSHPREVKNSLFSFRHSYLRHFSWRF